MGMGNFNPGCLCCEPCIALEGTPQVGDIQVTLPVDCERSGTFVLQRNDGHVFTSDCHNSPTISVTRRCAVWSERFGEGDDRDTIALTVGDEGGGNLSIVISLCNEGGCPGGIDTGTLWGSATITDVDHWDDLDGYTLSFANRATCSDPANEGSSYCEDPVGDASIQFLP